jgi:hypothetical protein
MLEFILQIFGELLIQIFGELLIKIGFKSLVEVIKQPFFGHPIFAGIGYVLWGIIIGCLSIIFFPKNFIHNPSLRWVNLVLSPVIIGTTMILFRWWLLSGKYSRLYTFSHGFVFGLSVATVRYFCTS